MNNNLVIGSKVITYNTEYGNGFTPISKIVFVNIQHSDTESILVISLENGKYYEIIYSSSEKAVNDYYKLLEKIKERE